MSHAHEMRNTQIALNVICTAKIGRRSILASIQHNISIEKQRAGLILQLVLDEKPAA